MVSQGDMSNSSLDCVGMALLRKLERAVHQGQLTLQSKILHLLQSVVAASSISSSREHRQSAPLNEKALAIGMHGPPDLSTDFEGLLITVIKDGLSSSANRSVLQHWVDFILMMAPQAQRRSFPLTAICTCVSGQLKVTLRQLQESYHPSSPQDLAMSLTEVEPIMLLNALERIVTLLSSTDKAKPSSETSRHSEGGSGILSMMSGVFTAETNATPESVSRDKHSALSVQLKHDSVYLDDAIEALLLTWEVTTECPSASSTGQAKVQENQVFIRTRQRAQVVLENLFRSSPSALIGACVRIWSSIPDAFSVSFGCESTDMLTGKRHVRLHRLAYTKCSESGRVDQREFAWKTQS